MDLISYMLENMDYHNMFSYIMRSLGWLIVNLLVTLLEALESLFETVYSLVGFIYSNEVVNYMQEKLTPLLAVLVAISVVALGYNLLVKSDDSDRKKVVGMFSQNFILFMIVLFLVPIILTGNSPYDSNGKYNFKTTEYSNDGLISYFRSELLDDLKYTNSESSENISTSNEIVSNYVTDWLWVYNKIGENGTYAGNSILAKNSADSLIKTSHKNYTPSTITDINYNVWINPTEKDGDDNNGTEFKGKSWGDSVGTTVAKGKAKVDGDVVDVSYLRPKEDTLEDYLFGYKHSLTEAEESFRVLNTSSPTSWDFWTSGLIGFTSDVFTDISETIDGTNVVNTEYYYTSEKCDAFNFGIEFFDSYPYRYTIDWLPLFISLIATCLVYFFISFKSATLIWDLVVNNILLYIFAAGDMTNGRRTREILKSIFSIFMTLIFIYVDLQVFLMSQNFLNTVGIESTLMKSLILIFFAYACIDGPNILQKIFGIDAGLSRPAMALAGASHFAVKTASKGAKKFSSAVSGATGLGLGIAGYMAGRSENRRTNGPIGGTGGTNTGNARNTDNTRANDTGVNTGGMDTETNANVGRNTDTNTGNTGNTDNTSNTSNIGGMDTNNTDTQTPEQAREEAFNNSFREQCGNLGLSPEETQQVMDDLSSANPVDNNRAFEVIGSHVDYDTATAPEKKGGLGYTDEELKDEMSRPDGNIEIGKNYVEDIMNPTAKKEGFRAEFNAQGNRKSSSSKNQAGQSVATAPNTRSNSLSSAGTRKVRAKHGDSILSAIAPRTTSAYRNARETGYNSYEKIRRRAEEEEEE